MGSHLNSSPSPRLSPAWRGGNRKLKLGLQQKRLAAAECLRFFNSYVAAGDALLATMLGPKDQRAVVIQRFGAAANFSIADVNGYLFADGAAMLLPFIGNLGKFFS